MLSIASRSALPPRHRLASPPVAHPLSPSMVQFSASRPPVDEISLAQPNRIPDDVYRLILEAPKNEIHVHQSGSSSIAFLKYSLLQAIKRGEIEELPLFKTAGEPEIVRFLKNGQLLQGAALREAMDKVLKWENLREYFRFQVQIDNSRTYAPSTSIADVSGNGMDLWEFDFGELRQKGLDAYRRTSVKINPYVKNDNAAYMLAYTYARDLALENVTYTEYRISPSGNNIGGNYGSDAENIIWSVQQGFEDALEGLDRRHFKLDYGLIVLMERQAKSPIKDVQKLGQDLAAFFERYGISAQPLKTAEYRRANALLAQAALVAQNGEFPESEAATVDLQAILLQHVTSNIDLDLSQIRQPAQLLTKLALLTADIERQKVQKAVQLAQKAIEMKEKGYKIVGVDLAGDEANNPVTEFREAFELIKRYNAKCQDPTKRLGITIHAGETAHSRNSQDTNLAGWQSIQQAIEIGWDKNTPVRIGHGLQIINSSPMLRDAFREFVENPFGWQSKFPTERIIEASPLLKQVMEKGVVLEMCPKSNLQTYGIHPEVYDIHPDRLHGIQALGRLPQGPQTQKYTAAAYALHPAVFLSRLGVKIAVSTDNRTISNSDTPNEFVKLFKYCGLTYDDFKRMILAGFEGAFVFDPAKRIQMMRNVNERFKRLESNPEHLIAMRKMGHRLTISQRFILWRTDLSQKIARLLEEIGRLAQELIPRQPEVTLY